MALQISIICLFLLTMFSAQAQQPDEFVILSSSEISYESPRPNFYRKYAVNQGAYSVFEFRSDNEAESGNHSVVPSIFAFQVEEEAVSFRFKDEEIFEHKGLYILVGKCSDQGVQPIAQGEITGVKMPDGSWSVSIDVTVIGRYTGKQYHIESNGTFTPETD